MMYTNSSLGQTTNVNGYKFHARVKYTTKIRLGRLNRKVLLILVFEELTDDEMYALDWQHDCFIFSPKEHIPFGYEEYDLDRNCQVYFPTYYPNGDYHVFVDKEWKYGLFGHPWKHEIVVMGEKLMEMFEKEKVSLGI